MQVKWFLHAEGFASQVLVFVCKDSWFCVMCKHLTLQGCIVYLKQPLASAALFRGLVSQPSCGFSKVKPKRLIWTDVWHLQHSSENLLPECFLQWALLIIHMHPNNLSRGRSINLTDICMWKACAVEADNVSFSVGNVFFFHTHAVAAGLLSVCCVSVSPSDLKCDVSVQWPLPKSPQKNHYGYLHTELLPAQYLL